MDSKSAKKTSFFKDNSYEITKLFINQIGITIFSLVLYTAAASIEDVALFSKVRTLLSIFAVVFFYALIYTAAWDFGARDKIRIDGGKLEESRFTGMKMALIANLPNFILAFFSTLFLGIYILSGNEGLYTAFSIFNFIIRFLSSMFLGLLQGIFSFLETSDAESRQYLLYFFWQSVGYLIVPVFTVGVTHFGYVMGLKDKKIFKIVSQNKKSK